MKLGHDIWLETTNMLASNGENQTLLSLALTSQTMSTIALPALWKSIYSGDQIVAIASIINARSPDGDKYIEREPINEGHWVSDLLVPVPFTFIS